METCSFALKIKQLTDEGKFTGYASTYGEPADLAGDVIAPGAFNSAIKMQPASGYPLLWSHRTDEPIGLARISDSPTGLVTEGQLLLSDPQASRVWGFIKNSIVKGISIGFNVNEKDVVYGKDGTRTLKQIFLHEVSLVSIPANPKAQVISVRSLDHVETVLRGVKPADVKDDVLLQLRGIDLALKALLRKDDSCECDCPECLAGDCMECSDPECTDPNCDGSMLAQQQAEELAALKSFALDLKKLTA
jgi:HK97 family phage prohead protease